MEARAKAGVPLVIGTAGTCGTDSAVDWMLDITREIAEEQGRPVKIAVLRSSQEPEVVAAAYEDGRVSALGNAPQIDGEKIRKKDNKDYIKVGSTSISTATRTTSK